jgi:epidermal growth factor receptor substrate 15
MIEAIETNFASLVASLKELDSIRKRANNSLDGPEQLVTACDHFCTSSKRVLRTTIQSVDRMIEEHNSLRYRINPRAEMPSLMDNRSIPVSMGPTDKASSHEKTRNLILSQKVIDYWKMYCFGQKVKRAVDKRQTEMLSHLQSAQKLAEGAKAEVNQVEQKEGLLKSEIQRSRSENAALIKQVQELNKKIVTLEGDHAAALRQTPGEDKMRQVQADLRLLNEQLLQSDETARGLSEELRKLRSDHATDRQSLETDIRNLQEKRQTLESDLSRLKKQNHDLDLERNHLQSDFEAESKRIKALEFELEKSKRDLSEKDKRLSELESEKSKMMTALQAEVESLRNDSRISQLESERSKLNDELESLRKDRAEKELRFAQLESDKHRLTELSAQLRSSEHEAVALGVELKHAQEARGRAEQESSELRKQVANLQLRLKNAEIDSSELAAAEDRLDGMQKEIQARECEITAMRDREQQLETELESARNEIKHKSKQIENMGDQMEELSDKLRLAESSKARLEIDLEQQLELLAAKGDQLESEQVPVLQDKRGLNKIHIEELQEKTQTQSQELERLRSEILALKRQLSEADKEQMAEISAELITSMDEKDSLRDRFEDARRQIHSLTCELSEMRNSISHLEQSNAFKDQEIRLLERYKSELESADSRIGSLKTANSDLERLLDELTGQLSPKQTENVALRRSLDALTVELSEKASECVRSACKVKELESSLEAARNELHQISQNLEQHRRSVDQKNDELRNLQLEKKPNEDRITQLLAENQSKDEVIAELQFRIRMALSPGRDMYNPAIETLQRTINELWSANAALVEQLKQNPPASPLEAQMMANSYQAAMDEMRKEVSRLKGVVTSRDTEIARLKVELDEVLREAKSMQDRYEDRIRESNQELSRNDDRSQLVARINLLDQDLNEAETEIEELSSKWEKSQAELELKTKAATELRNRVEEVETAYEAILKSLKGTSAEGFAETEKELSELRFDLSEAQRAIQAMASELADSDEAAATMKNLLNAAENDLERLVGQLAVAETDKANLKTRIESERTEAEKRTAQLSAQVTTLQECISEQRARVLELEKAVESTSTLALDSAGTAQAVSEAETRPESLKQEVERLQVRIDELTRDLAEADEETIQLESALQERDELIETERKSNQKESDKLRKELEKARNELNLMMAENEKLASEKSHNDSVIDRLRAQEIELQKQLEDREDEQRSLTARQKEEWNKLEKELKAKLSATESELKSIRDRRDRVLLTPQVGKYEIFSVNTKGEEQLVQVLQASLKAAEARQIELLDERLKLESRLAQLDGQAGNNELLNTINKLVDEKSALMKRLSRLEELLESREKGKVQSLQQVIRDIVAQAKPAITLQPLSEYVSIDAGGSVASYVGINKDSDMCGCAITNSPLPLFEEGVYFEVRVTATQSNNPDGLTVGLTTTVPWKGDPVPNTLDDIPHSWAVGYNGQSWNSGKGEWKPIQWCGKDLIEGQRVGVFLAAPPVSQLFIFVDDILVCRGPSRLPSCVDYSYFGLVDLLGNCDAVTLLWGAKPPPAASELIAVDPHRFVKHISPTSSRISEESPSMMKSSVLVPRLALKPTVEPNGPVRPPSESDADTFRFSMA